MSCCESGWSLAVFVGILKNLLSIWRDQIIELLLSSAAELSNDTRMQLLQGAVKSIRRTLIALTLRASSSHVCTWKDGVRHSQEETRIYNGDTATAMATETAKRNAEDLRCAKLWMLLVKGVGTGACTASECWSASRQKV